jgi:hypothetical protein
MPAASLPKKRCVLAAVSRPQVACGGAHDRWQQQVTVEYGLRDVNELLTAMTRMIAEHPERS